MAFLSYSSLLRLLQPIGKNVESWILVPITASFYFCCAIALFNSAALPLLSWLARFWISLCCPTTSHCLPHWNFWKNWQKISQPRKNLKVLPSIKFEVFCRPNITAEGIPCYSCLRVQIPELENVLFKLEWSDIRTMTDLIRSGRAKPRRFPTGIAPVITVTWFMRNFRGVRWKFTIRRNVWQNSSLLPQVLRGCFYSTLNRGTCSSTDLIPPQRP